jgi:calcium-dependent protein kinase
MEKCNGGELFDKISHNIRKKEMFKEKEAAYILFQIISALYYLHSNGISHRDLKPENLLYYNKGNDIKNPIKLIDFDLSNFFNQKMKTKVGTSYYVSPEVLKGEYNEKCDIWSAGVILYILLSGQPPFNGSNDRKIYKKIMNLDYNFNKDIWKNISSDAIDLIKKCICFENERLSAKDVLSHKWFNIVYDDFYSLNNDLMLSFNFDNLVKYSHYNSFKKIILNIIVYRLNDDDIKDLKNIFFFFDCDHDGIISKDDFYKGLKKLNVNNENVENIFISIDSDNDGFINYTEFLSALINEKLFLDDKRLLEAFLIFETNEKGKLPNNEIENILNSENEKMIKEIIVKIDKNCEINYCDFYKLMELNSSMNCN